MLPKKLVVLIVISLLLYEGSTKNDGIDNEELSPETILLNDDNETEDVLNGPVDTVLQLTDEAKSQNERDNVKEYQMENDASAQPWKSGNSWSSSWGGNTDGNNMGWGHWSSWGGNSRGMGDGGNFGGRWGGNSGNKWGGNSGHRWGGNFGNRWGGNSEMMGGGNFGGKWSGGWRGSSRNTKQNGGKQASSGNYANAENLKGSGGRWRSGGNKANGQLSENFGIKYGMNGGNFGINYGMGGEGNAMGSHMGGGQGSQSGQSGCIAEDGGWFVIRHSSEKCVLPNDQSRKSGTKIVLGSSDCKNQNYVFVWTAKQSIKHVISGMCITLQGENLVLKEGCDGDASTQFQYIAAKKRLMSSGKTVQATQGGIGMMALVATESAPNGPEAMFTFESAIKMNIKFSFTFGMSGMGLEVSSAGGEGQLGGGGLGLGGAGGSMEGGGTITSGGMIGGGNGGINGGFSGSVGGSFKGGAGSQINGGTRMFVIRHQESGMCLYPKDGKKRNIALVLDNKCDDPKAVFQFSSKNSIESVALSGYYLSVRRGRLQLRKSSLKKSKLFNFNANTMAFTYRGKYVLPKQRTVVAGTRLVVRKRKFQSWMAFQTLVATASGGMIGQGSEFFGTTSTGGLGGMSGETTSKMAGGMSGGIYGAEASFVIKHSQSGLCLYPEGGIRADDVPIILARKCNEREAMFAWTKEQTLKSVAFEGFCLHPKKGQSNPDDNTELVIFKECKGNRLRFTYEPNTMSLKHEISGKYIKPKTQYVEEGSALVIGSEATVGAWMQFKFISVSGKEANGAEPGRTHKLIKFGGLKGRKGGRFGMNIGGQMSGSSSSGNEGNFKIQFGKGNSKHKNRGSSSWGGKWKSGGYGSKAGQFGEKEGGGISSSSSWGSSWKSNGHGGETGQFGEKGGGGLSSSSSWGSSWKSNGHGGKVNDDISPINGNNGGSVMTNLHPITSGTKVNDNGNKINGNFHGGFVNEHGGDDSQNVESNEDVGYGRYSSAHDVNILDPNHNDGTTVSDNGDGSIRLQKFLLHRHRNGERNYGSHTIGVNNDRTDSETGRGNGEIINNHQNAGNTGPFIPSANVDNNIDGGGRYGKRPVLGVNGMVSNSEKNLNDKTSTSNDNGMNDGDFQKGGNSGEFMVGNSQKSNSNEVVSKDDGKTVENGGNNDGMLSKDIGRIGDGNAGSKLGVGGNMMRNSNDGRLHGVVFFNHPRDMINVDGNPHKIRPNDETVGGKSHRRPPDTSLLNKKNNISRNDGSNNGSTGISYGNSSGTHDHKGLWKFGKMENISTYQAIVNDSNAGDSKETIMTSEDKNAINDQHGIMNEQKKDITVHPGIEGDKRTKLHHNNGSHHNKTTVHLTKHSHFKKKSGPTGSLKKSKEIK